MNDEPVYRTALATPGLLRISSHMVKELKDKYLLLTLQRHLSESCEYFSDMFRLETPIYLCVGSHLVIHFFMCWYLSDVSGAVLGFHILVLVFGPCKVNAENNHVYNYILDAV